MQSRWVGCAVSRIEFCMAAKRWAFQTGAKFWISRIRASPYPRISRVHASVYPRILGCQGRILTGLLLPLGMGRILTLGAEAAAFTQFLWERRDLNTSGENVNSFLTSFCVCYTLAGCRERWGKVSFASRSQLQGEGTHWAERDFSLSRAPCWAGEIKSGSVWTTCFMSSFSAATL